MDFAFSEEQEMLRGQARQFVTDRFPPERVAELADSKTWDDKAWREIAELGWVGLSASEEAGGAGMSFLDEAVLFEELGYGLYSGPYFSTVALALPALERSGDVSDVVSGEVTATLAWLEADGAGSLMDTDALRTQAKGSGDSWNLSGTKRVVPELDRAGRVVVVASTPNGPGLFAVEAEGQGVTRTSAETMDPTRPYGTLELADAPARLLASGDDAQALLGRIRFRALGALALEAVGIAQKMMDLSIAHVQERKQFDKPIGTYQAVSHQVVDAYVGTELSRSLAYWAAWSVAEEENADVAASTAKAFASEAAVFACERCIQVHGGIGFTWEHVAHRYYKRAQWIDSFEGYGAIHRARVAESLIDA